MTRIGDALKELDIEDIIWIITLFTITMALYSNQLEREYLITKDLQKQKLYKTINITLLCIAFFIYLYFVLLTYQKIKSQNPNTSFKEVRIKNANFIAAVLVLLATIIYLISTIVNDNQLNQ